LLYPFVYLLVVENYPFCAARKKGVGSYRLNNNVFLPEEGWQKKPPRAYFQICYWKDNLEYIGCDPNQICYTSILRKVNTKTHTVDVYHLLFSKIYPEKKIYTVSTEYLNK